MSVGCAEAQFNVWGRFQQVAERNMYLVRPLWGDPAPALSGQQTTRRRPVPAAFPHPAARVAPKAGLDNFTPNANPQVLVLMGSIPLMSVVLGTVMREKLVTPLERIFAVIESNTSAVFGAPHAPALPCTRGPQASLLRLTERPPPQELLRQDAARRVSAKQTARGVSLVRMTP